MTHHPQFDQGDRPTLTGPVTQQAMGESPPPHSRPKRLRWLLIVIAATATGYFARSLPGSLEVSFTKAAESEPPPADPEEREALSQEANVVLTQAIIQAMAGEEVDLEELIREAREDKKKREDPAEIKKREQAEARQLREKSYLERWNTP